MTRPLLHFTVGFGLFLFFSNCLARQTVVANQDQCFHLTDEDSVAVTLTTGGGNAADQTVTKIDLLAQTIEGRDSRAIGSKIVRKQGSRKLESSEFNKVKDALRELCLPVQNGGQPIGGGSRVFGVLQKDGSERIASTATVGNGNKPFFLMSRAQESVVLSAWPKLEFKAAPWWKFW